MVYCHSGRPTHCPGFNRTSVELKLRLQRAIIIIHDGFNRTSVELKSGIREIEDVTRQSFNRTSVELKSQQIIATPELRAWF